MATIQTKGLTYRYGIGTPFEKTAVDHVDLEIESGSFVGIIGHTGSGKSTLIQHLNGLLKPTEGSILLDGKDIWAEKAQMRQVRFRVGLVFQYPEYQIFEETVAKDIAFGPRNMGLAEEEVQARVKETAAIVGLSDDILEQSPFLLSGGQKRRVAIAGVMAMRPEVFILHEPTAGLDPRGREEILEEIGKVAEKENIRLAQVTGLGAINDFTAGVYNTVTKEYHSIQFQGAFEIVSLTGTVTRKDGDVYLHLHIAAGDEEGHVHGGHLNRAIISATAEIQIQVIDGEIGREFSQEIGLNLFKF